jgi:putative FmdB family regulatory protein
MPIYEYKCEKCNNEFEYLVLGGNDEVVCPECDTKKVNRVMSACSFKSNGGNDFSPSSGSSSSCSGCSSSNCSSCH